LAGQTFTGSATFPDSTDVGAADFDLVGNGFADGTFSFNFVDTDLSTLRTYTQQGGGSIPVPAPIWLMLPMLGGLLARHRRQQG